MARRPPHLAGSKTPSMHGNIVCGTRETLHLAWSIAARPARRTQQGHGCEARGQGVGQLHSTKEASEQHPRRIAMAEDVEGRELAKGKAGEQTRVRTQCRSALQRALDRIRQAARRDHAKPLTALWHHVYDLNDSERRITDSTVRRLRGLMGRPGRLMEKTWRQTCETCQTALGEGHTTPAPSSGCTSLSQMAASGPSASPPWKIRSSSGRRWRC